jgi:uncharacterized membrane protein
MKNTKDQINELEEKLSSLISKQNNISNEIRELRDEFNSLKGRSQTEERVCETAETKQAVEKQETVSTPEPPPAFEKLPETEFNINKSNLEKFIGENLISKIGIVITIIGVAIGAKYSIEHQLISPLVRIVLGYLTGLGLLGVGIKLKEKYVNYSAVLVSGAIAILYFITYAGYSFYDLFPQAFAFALMLVFTVFAVIAAIHYNRQVIAHIGLVGAYAVPFLLSDTSGQIAVLFSYMAIINIGILIIAYKKYWKSLYYSSFALTWIIYLVWYVSISYWQSHQFGLAFTFLSVFYAIFYVVFLAYKLVGKEKFAAIDILPLLVNSFLFYGIGYSIIQLDNTLRYDLLGLFTLANAVIHFAVSVVIYKQKLADRNLLYFIIALVFVFITIAIPVQLDGHWVTLLWLAQAFVLFMFGRIKQVSIFEKIAYFLMIFAFFSLIHDWSVNYSRYSALDTPVFNVQFLTSVLFIAAFASIVYVLYTSKYPPAFTPQKELARIIRFAVPTILLIALYFSMRLEIAHYYDRLWLSSRIEVGAPYSISHFNMDLNKFKQIWIINYSLLFVSVLTLFNIIKLKNREFGICTIVLSVIFLFGFLTMGLYALSELRDSYLNPNNYYLSTVSHIVVRYVCLVFVGFTLYTLYKQLNQNYLKPVPNKVRISFDYLLHVALLWIFSSELISWLDITGVSQTYGFGLSILWGVYALSLIALGIWKKKKHLRMGAIILLGTTLLKLFFYDLKSFDTISKTVVLIVLGILLLTISFLYNKYKHLITDENKD